MFIPYSNLNHKWPECLTVQLEKIRWNVSVPWAVVMHFWVAKWLISAWIISVQHPNLHSVPLSFWFSLSLMLLAPHTGKKRSHPLEVKTEGSRSTEERSRLLTARITTLTGQVFFFLLWLLFCLFQTTQQVFFYMCLFHPVVSWFMTMHKLLRSGEEGPVRARLHPSWSPRRDTQTSAGGTQNLPAAINLICVCQKALFFFGGGCCSGVKLKKTILAESVLQHSSYLIPHEREREGDRRKYK